MKKNNNNFDIIVIGAGSGGLNIASFMNRVGFKTLLIDKTDRSIGGDCLNFGCVPSKALIHVAREVEAARRAASYTTNPDQKLGDIDFKKVLSYVQSKIEHIREHENADYFRSKGMTVVLGTAKFDGKNSVKVNDTSYTAKNIVIATGSKPIEIKIPGIEKAKVYTNENIFYADTLPKKLVVIGGGPIGVELGQTLSLLGSDVTIISNGDRLLPREDSEITQILSRHLDSNGIKTIFNAKPIEVKDGTRVIVEKSDGSKTEIECDAILVAIGRELNLDLDLEKAEIKKTEDGRKLIVNEYLQTTNKNIYVCGDVAGQHQFTHAAEVHAGVLLKNFFSPFKTKLNTDGMAWVTYTLPEVATFGIQESDLKNRKIKYEVLTETFAEDDRAIVDESTDGLVKLFISPKGVILGGTMIGKNAGELIQELILAQTHKMKIKDIFKKVYPYPTATRINKRIASQYMGRSLSERSKKILHFLYK